MKKFKFTINGNAYDVSVKDVEDFVAHIEVNGTQYDVELEKTAPVKKTPKIVVGKPKAGVVQKVASDTVGVSKINAPLPGTIFKIECTVGDDVKKGDKLMILEAMKMENSILAEKDGTIKSIKVNQGQAVLQGDLLIEIE